jgi:hypothetical protein
MRRAFVFGLLLAIGSTAVYVTSLVNSLSHSVVQADGAHGAPEAIDPGMVIQNSTLRSPAYWLMATIFLTSGFVVVLFRLRPTP